MGNAGRLYVVHGLLSRRVWRGKRGVCGGSQRNTAIRTGSGFSPVRHPDV